MAFLRVLCRALIFIPRMRILPAKSIKPKSTRQLTIANNMEACQFYRVSLRAKISFNTSYEKFDLSTYVSMDKIYSR